MRFVHRLDKGETSKELFYGVNFIRSKRVLNEQGNKRKIFICLYFNALNYKGVLLSFRGCRLSHWLDYVGDKIRGINRCIIERVQRKKSTLIIHNYFVTRKLRKYLVHLTI